MVMTGKDKGKTGTIDQVFPKKQKVLVSGVNMYKRHAKKKDEKDQGGILDLARPLNISKVAFVDKKTKKPTRLGYLMTKNEKVRISKKSNNQV